ncbi:MAG: hypothetical protein GKR89_18165 [Candidatus Latescibacteria bacterium]|nr:hypothetical protein [Candidatus Latescibacterota bacterium]
MQSYLLAWNPNVYPWEELPQDAHVVTSGGLRPIRWSCGNNRRPEAGDQAFLIKLGVEPRGLIGRGTIVRGSFEDYHFRQERAREGKKCRYIEILFDSLVDGHRKVVVGMPELQLGVLAKQHWSTQISGIQIKPPVVNRLEEIWDNRLNDK